MQFKQALTKIACVKHGDRQGRHYYTTLLICFSYIVVATLAVAMSHGGRHVSRRSPCLIASHVVYSIFAKL